MIVRRRAHFSTRSAARLIRWAMLKIACAFSSEHSWVSLR